MKRCIVIDCIAIVINVVAAATHFCIGNTHAGIAWLAAATWCVACLFVELRVSDWKDIAKQSIDALEAHLGGRVVCVGKIKMDGKGQDVSGSKDASKEIPGPIEDALKGMVECTKEALHYIGQGNFEFTVSHNGVDMKISISDEEVEKWKREHAVKEEVDGCEKADV